MCDAEQNPFVPGRRSVIKLLGLTILGMHVPVYASNGSTKASQKPTPPSKRVTQTHAPSPRKLVTPREKTLSLDALNTGEKLRSVTFWERGRYVPEGLQEISHLLRDWRTDDVHAIDPQVLDLLFDLRRLMGVRAPIEVVSGYRSPETNQKLAASSRRVARKSYHMQGMAVDIKIEGASLAHLRKAALSLERGGVGYYPRTGFLHVDSGPVRQWSG